MKALKVKFKSWNNEVFGRVEERKKAALKKLAYWDEVESQRTLSLNEEAKVDAMEDFKSLALSEETSWRQKSRELWLTERDRNTGFVHRMANSHKRGNCIVKLRINGILITEEEELKQGIVNAFKSFLSD